MQCGVRKAKKQKVTTYMVCFVYIYIYLHYEITVKVLITWDLVLGRSLKSPWFWFIRTCGNHAFWVYFNTLCPSVTIWRHKTWSTFHQVMACHLWHQAITWNNADLWSFGPSVTNSSRIWISIPSIIFNKMHLKIPCLEVICLKICSLYWNWSNMFYKSVSCFLLQCFYSACSPPEFQWWSVWGPHSWSSV